jgi:glutamate-1-semialdehyde 2,1-aminomutase
MVAGLTTLKKLADGRIYSELEQKNRNFVSELTSRLNGSTINVAGVASMFWIVFQRELPRSSAAISKDGISHYNRMHSKVLNIGLYVPPSGYEVCFVSAAHTDEMLSEAADKLATLIKEEAHEWE